MNGAELMALALKARENAYTPYSGFRVGAALLAASGKVYLGCNIENAAYSPTNCAERTAFFTAVAAGERKFEALAVVGGMGDSLAEETFPCGVCRQVMAEFCGPDFILYVGKPDGFQAVKLKEILPYAFTSDSLE